MAQRHDRDPFTQAMINLRSHLVKCYKCRFAFGDGESNDACDKGVLMAVTVVKAADKLLDTKRHAVSTINNYVYACPDIAVHGEAYALTAQPLSVNGIQDELF